MLVLDGFDYEVFVAFREKAFYDIFYVSMDLILPLGIRRQLEVEALKLTCVKALSQRKDNNDIVLFVSGRGWIRLLEFKLMN